MSIWERDWEVQLRHSFHADAARSDGQEDRKTRVKVVMCVLKMAGVQGYGKRSKEENTKEALLEKMEYRER